MAVYVANTNIRADNSAASVAAWAFYPAVTTSATQMTSSLVQVGTPTGHSVSCSGLFQYTLSGINQTVSWANSTLTGFSLYSPTSILQASIIGAYLPGSIYESFAINNDAAGLVARIFIGNDTITGSAYNDVLWGYAGNDTIDGLGWADIAVGGLGDDIYVVENVMDVVIENPGEGYDVVKSSVNYTLSSNVEELTLTGVSAIYGTGNALDNHIAGNSANNVLNGDLGVDYLNGWAGDDSLDGGVGNDTLNGGVGNDTLRGGTGNDTLRGETGSDIYLFGLGDGQDVIYNSLGFGSVTTILAGSAELDVVQFGAGIAPADVTATRNLNTGTLVLSINGTQDSISIIWYFKPSTSWDATNQVFVSSRENAVKEIRFADGSVWTMAQMDAIPLILNGTSGDDVLSAAENDETIYGFAGNDFLWAYRGNDTLIGGAGDDTMAGYAGNDTYIFYSGDGKDIINNYDTGNEPFLNASFLPWTDALQFGSGISAATVMVTRDVNNLVLTIENSTDSVTIQNYFKVTAEWDVAYSYQQYMRASVLDEIRFADGTVWTQRQIDAQFSLNVGTTASDILLGTVYDDTLDGSAGADLMIGESGNDIYIVDNVADITTETSTLATEIDTVQSSVTRTLGANLENLLLTGAAAINGIGNTLNNTLTGNAAANILSGLAGNDILDGGVGDDTLDGGNGIDTMTGGLGNDTYVVNMAGDITTEISTLATEIDTVQSSVSRTLGANLENLTLTGATAINGNGNVLNNALVGNAADNVLNGGQGADRMTGGLGNDTYIVDNVADVTTETSTLATEIDTVKSSVTRTLGANLEYLFLTGTAAINGSGNALNNILVGNAADNVLNGVRGADRMTGGLGSDTYIVDNVADVTTETSTLATEIDTVRSSVTRILGANLENLVLTGAAVINGTGNTLNNTLTGNAAANTLTGAAGNDTLDGGAGNDFLNGGAGNDTYLFGRAGGVDRIADNGGADVLSLAADVSFDQLWFRHVANDLEVGIIGAADTITVSNWYLNAANRVEQIQAGGKTLSGANVETLVQAMAAFAPPAAGQTTLSPTYQATLNTVIAANWV